MESLELQKPRFYTVVDFRRKPERYQVTCIGYMDAHDMVPVLEAIRNQWIPAMQRAEPALVDPVIAFIRRLPVGQPIEGMTDIAAAIGEAAVNSDPFLAAIERQMESGSATDARQAT